MTSAPPESRALSRGRSLRWRVGLVVGGAMLLILGCSILISTLLVRHFFANLQDNLIRNRIDRVSTVLDLQAKAKIDLLRDSAEWDDTYEFIEGQRPEFLRENFDPEINSTHEDLIMVFDAQKKLLGVVQPQLADEPAEAYQLPSGLNVDQLAGSALLGAEPAAGLAFDGKRVLLFASHPTTRSDFSGPVNGWLVFGTYLEGATLETLSALAGAKLKVVPLPAGYRESSDFVEMKLSTKSLGPLKGFYPPVLTKTGSSGHPAFRICVPALVGDREIAFEGALSMVVFKYALQARNKIILLSIGCGVALLAITLVVMQRSFLNPLEALDREIQEISQTDGAPGFLAPRRNDEIGRLAESANRLLRRVFTERTRAQEQEELMSSILDSATEGVLALRAGRGSEGTVSDLQIVLFNRFAEKLFEVQAEEVLGKSLSERFPQMASSGVSQRLIRTSELRQPETFETYYEDSRIKGWFRISVAPWGDGVVMTCNNITDRKTREEELAASYAEVERFNAAMIGREQRIVEMKAEVNQLRERLGLPPVYESAPHDA